MRPIDAEPFEVYCDSADGSGYEGEAFAAYIDGMKAVLESIDEAPTIAAEDLQPRGHWTVVEEKGYVDTLGNPATHAECSHCSGKWTDTGTAKRYFRCCPYCGARMDEEATHDPA